MTKRNIYSHKIDLKKLNLKNSTRKAFVKQLEKIPYRGYEVEQLKDGKKIVITKPGGKRSMYGQPKKEDFQVFLYDEKNDSLWQVTHDQIKDEIKHIGGTDAKEAVKIIDALEEVFNGKDPNFILPKYKFKVQPGISPEGILKLCKWIWGQEDVNYPNLLGREMVWFGKKRKNSKVVKTRDGFVDIRTGFQRKLK